MAEGTRRPPRLQLDKSLRNWLDSPQERALRERARRIPKLGFPPDDDEQHEPEQRPSPSLELSAPPQPESQQHPEPEPEPEPLRPEPSPEPKKTGGRRRKLTDDEIARLQAAYEAAYRDNPKRKQSDVFNDLRNLLRREVSDTTLRDRIVRPLARK